MAKPSSLSGAAGVEALGAQRARFRSSAARVAAPSSLGVRFHWCLACALSVACASASPLAPVAVPPPAASAEPQLEPASAPAQEVASPVERVGWLEGRWQHADGIEHWVAAGGVLWGVGFNVRAGATAFFEVLTVENAAGNMRYTAMPAGKTEVSFPLSEATAAAVVFANPAHDAPKIIRYQRNGDQLTARTEGGESAQTFEWQRGPAGKADALEAADRAFAADVAQRGIEGWVAAFAEDGAMWNRRRKARLEGAAIREAMTPLFAQGVAIEWSPVASGLSPAGDLGYTVGTSRFTEPGKGGERVEVHRGSYVSIWRRQSDGSWKVLFDTGN